ncbi:MAG TPA: LptF/LptG family permease [Chthonomonadales bacterium]|nr:LptF/LptG family permease [Chthonomonadales bacterium]
MKLMDRYIVREMVVPFLIGQAAIVMLLTGSVLYNNATVLLMNQIPWRDVARMVLYFIPFLVHMTMPVAMAVGASLAVSRLTRDSEITVMRAAGCSLVRIFLPVFVAGLLVSVVDFYFGEYVVPASMNRFEAVLGEMPNHIPRLTPEAGRWITSFDQSYTVFVKTMIPRRDSIELRGVKLVSSPSAYSSGAASNFVAVADSGSYSSSRWTLFHAVIVDVSPDGKTVTEARPEKLTMRFDVDPQAFQSGFLLQLPMGTMAQNSTRTFSELGAQIKQDTRQRIRDPSAILDYHFKLSVPFSCLVMAICCPPLALRFGKGGGFMGTLLSICLVFVYWNTLLLARILGSPGPQGTAPWLAPPVAAWSQNVLFVLLGLAVLRLNE